MARLSKVRAISLATAACAGLFWPGLCRVADATDIDSPANVNGSSQPSISLNQTGGTSYHWRFFGDDNSFGIEGENGKTHLVIESPSDELDLAFPERLRLAADGSVGMGTITPNVIGQAVGNSSRTFNR